MRRIKIHRALTSREPARRDKRRKIQGITQRRQRTHIQRRWRIRQNIICRVTHDAIVELHYVQGWGRGDIARVRDGEGGRRQQGSGYGRDADAFASGRVSS